jgi:decaprenylphospho-beta-D-ribofuranose 2-oxidase
VPLDLPGFVLNPLTVRAFNEIYWRRVPARGTERAVPLRRFLYPLDGLYDWNRLYGKRGFHQFQCVLPNAHAPRGVRLILEEVARAGRASFLAVLKATGPAGLGHLSFPLPGLTLALDFPAGPGTREFLARLERMVLDHGGRIYLAKDSVLSPEGFRAMYPRLAEFLAVRHAIDPHGSLGSDMARRLGIA